jgi:uncharacterized protein YegJ (DUF2314 family)
MLWVAVGAGVLLAVVAIVAYWRYRKRRQSRLISFVALLREARPFDPAMLAQVAGKVWAADLGDGATQGKDGFVVGVGVMNTIMHDERMYLINSLPHPYTENVEEAAQHIGDLRIRKLFLEHKAWFSCDAMGVDGRTDEAEVQELYRRLGKLFAELLDDNCLLIFLPDSNLAFPINEDTELALQSNAPVQALQQTLTVPIIQVSPDDPLMKQAVDKARQDWPKFVAAFETQGGEHFSVKAPVTYGDNTEFIWISVTSLEGERIYGTLGNEPNSLGPLKLGSKVSVLVQDLNDWCYMDSSGNPNGGFTVEAVQQASRRNRPK